MRTKLWAGRRLLLMILVVALSYSCAGTPCKSPYRVVIPILEAEPQIVTCRQGLTETRCLLLLEEDHRRVVRELKAACLALGGSAESCRTQLAHSRNNLSPKP